VGVWVGGHPRANLWHISKDTQENSTSFDINVVVGGDGANMVLNEKPTKNWKPTQFVTHCSGYSVATV